jgi:hypothetical protein
MVLMQLCIGSVNEDQKPGLWEGVVVRSLTSHRLRNILRHKVRILKLSYFAHLVFMDNVICPCPTL